MPRVLSVSGVVVPPPETSSESKPVVSCTIRCTIPSLFRQLTVCPAVTVAGLGENELAPSWPITLMVTSADRVGVVGESELQFDRNVVERIRNASDAMVFMCGL